MNRLSPALLALALGIVALLGAGPVRPITDYGASPQASPAANRAAIQAALDDARNPALKERDGVVVKVPAGVYPVDRPLVLPGYTTLRGEGRDVSTIAMANGNADPVLIAGIDRKPGGVTLTPDHLFDLFGRLDATAADAPGKRWGIATLGNSHVAQGAGPFANGPWPTDGSAPNYYGGLTTLAIEWAVDQDAAPFRQGPQFGMMDRGRPGPWCVYTAGIGGGCWVATYQLQQGGVERTVALLFPAPTGGGVHRFAVEIDTRGRTARAYVDDLQVTLGAGIAWGADPTPISLAPARNVPFTMGSCGLTANNHGSDWIGGDNKWDRAYCGLRVSTAPVYRDLGPGQPITRIDAQPVNDAARFFAYAAASLAWLPLDRSPEQVVADRFIDIRAARGPTRTSALFLSTENGSNWASLAGNSIRDLSILGINGCPWGAAVNLGFALDFDAAGCRLRGGAHGLGTWNWGANYPIRVRDCEVSGTDSALRLYYAVAAVDRCKFPSGGRNTVDAWGSPLALTDCFFAGMGRPECVGRFSGGRVTITRPNVDYEDGASPSDAAWRMTATGISDRTCWLRVVDWDNGAVPKGRPLVRLDQSGNPGPASFLLDGLNCAGEAAAVASVEGAAWSGTVRHAVPFRSTPAVRYAPGVPATSFAVAPGTPNPAPAIAGPPAPTTP